ncbi:hypothetical protein [Pseudomonas aeruginosa]|nr:hypothetical protein [Pseudomonas aeruginosa]MBG5166835.1 hypothetical protein [Pseudomonas aeruginosa]MBS9747746.1 hypothetical protein [Pseudomonas aeruginosa]MBX6656345.1 hypothetical protein [Pseudomonas aeruginosa]MBX6818002.1 hypothetical protein [Pseudomonas aeruginosa]MCT5063171.1 hypothetical protein [Pseudomonas aeruginosa]
MKKLKSERHHWWPRCVSKHWADAEGFTHWITPDGTDKRVPPAKLGMIGNGHHIKLSQNSADSSPWDMSFEREFDVADGNFPSLIEWLNALTKQELFGRDLRDRFVPQSCTDDQLKILTECVVSLVVRSPKNREAAVSVAEQLRGELPTPERNALIGLNMRQSQRMIADSIGGRAKFAVLFSSGKEFIYGDGFFNNVTGVGNPLHSPKIIAPITPMMAVIINRPTSFMVEPRLSTIVLSDDEVEACVVVNPSRTVG